MDYDFTQDWFSQNIPAWQRVIHGLGLQARKVLEVGSYEGRSSTWIVENVVGPQIGHMFCIDSWDATGIPAHSNAEIQAVESRFDRNMKIALAKFPGTQLTKLSGRSREIFWPDWPAAAMQEVSTSSTLTGATRRQLYWLISPLRSRSARLVLC